MKYAAIGAGGLLLLGVLASSQGEAQTLAAAELRNAQGDVVGNAVLTETPHGVKIALQVSRLPPGRHGLHIHAVGRCEPPGFTSAGGHFNPLGKKHGMMSAEGPHSGDLPNLVVAADGTASLELYVPGATLGPGATSLLPPDGTALVIHANPDDEMTDPAGNAGGRIACGVIVRRGN